MDTKSKLYNNKIWAGILLAQIVLFYLFSKLSIFVGLNSHFFEIQKSFHQRIFSWIPFSFGDVFYLIMIVWLVYAIWKITRKSSRKKGFFQLLVFGNCIYFIYQIFWGLLYFEKPLLYKLPEGKITIEETKILAEQYLQSCKLLRTKVKEDQNGVFRIQNFKDIQNQISVGQNHLPKWLTTKKGTEIISLKPSLFRGIMSDTGILGYYNPFTAEAQYNPELPHTYLPFTLSHESAHQLGFAREQEANFIGFLVGTDAQNLDLNYSAQYFALKSLINALKEQNPNDVQIILNDFSPAMKRDLLYEKKFREMHEGMLDYFFEITNNLFLKSNQQEGIVTYSYFTELLIRYERIKQKNRVSQRDSKNTNDEKKFIAL